jgi:hypothetical protein
MIHSIGYLKLFVLLFCIIEVSMAATRVAIVTGSNKVCNNSYIHKYTLLSYTNVQHIKLFCMKLLILGHWVLNQ